MADNSALPDEKQEAGEDLPKPRFEDFAIQRKLLQEFCPAHLPSLEPYVSKSFPIFRLDDEGPEPTELRHITSTATCYESIATCPDKFRPSKKENTSDFAALGRDFAQRAIKLGPEKWVSDGAAGVYCSSRGLPYVVSQLEGWQPEIDLHLARILYQLGEDPLRMAIGEADKGKDKKSWYRPNAYHTYWTLELLRALEVPKFKNGSKELETALGYRPQMYLWARQQLGVQAALHSANSSVLDSDQLAWSLAILISRPEEYQSRLGEQDLIRQALRCLFSTQEQVGTWRHYAPLFHYPNAGNAYCYVFETFATILKESLRPEADFVRDALRRYFGALVKLWRYAVQTQTKRNNGLLAWSSGHRNKPVLESWATASVFAYAQNLRKLVGRWTQEEALNALNYKRTKLKKDAEDDVVSRSDIWTCPDLADRLWSMFINPASFREEQSDPDEPLIDEQFPRSAILFGPPGTSKTLLVQALAGAIGWKYIELHPSHFVAEGLPSVQQTADVIFKKLMECDRAVILFDEIDELVRERDIEPDQFGRFLTTSMLPRLAELWKGRRVMYFVATNHIEYFDRAVTRSERFDAIIFISPPSFVAKCNRLISIVNETYGLEVTLAPDITQATIERAIPPRCEVLANATDKKTKDAVGAERLERKYLLSKFALLRYDELNELALQVQKILKNTKIISKGTLKTALGQIKDSKSRTLGEYCRFNSDREDYERFDVSKNARWIIEEIEGFADSAPLPKSVGKKNGVLFTDAPVGPLSNVSVSGYRAERIMPGKIRLNKT